MFSLASSAFDSVTLTQQMTAPETNNTKRRGDNTVATPPNITISRCQAIQVWKQIKNETVLASVVALDKPEIQQVKKRGGKRKDDRKHFIAHTSFDTRRHA
jgi:hypothetical protein